MKVDNSAKYVQVVDCSGKMFWYSDKIGKVFQVTGYKEKDYIVMNEDNVDSYLIDVRDCCVVSGVPVAVDVEQPKPIDAHYTSFVYTLTEDDKQAGMIKVDPYFVSNQWQLGAKDNTGILFHCLKNIARFSDKNTKEREIIALFKQVKRLAELEKVNLEGQ